MPGLNRREFVALTALAACSCALAGEDAFADAPAAFDAGPISDFEKDGAYDKFVKSNKLMIVRKGTRITALSSVCTHKNCAVKIKDDGFKCPCHGSLFTGGGDVTKGPAKAGLGRYKASINDDKHLIVDLSSKLDVGAAEGEVEVK
jgi:Rieske Fe-S protein